MFASFMICALLVALIAVGMWASEKATQVKRLQLRLDDMQQELEQTRTKRDEFEHYYRINMNGYVEARRILIHQTQAWIKLAFHIEAHQRGEGNPAGWALALSRGWRGKCGEIEQIPEICDRVRQRLSREIGLADAA